MNYFEKIAEENIKRLKEQRAKLQRQKEEEERFEQNLRFRLMLNNSKFEDFGVRHVGGHVESYNLHTGETLYTASCETEAWADLREEFGRT